MADYALAQRIFKHQDPKRRLLTVPMIEHVLDVLAALPPEDGVNREVTDLQAAMRALWPDRPKVYFREGQGDDAPVLTGDEQQLLRRVATAIGRARTER